MVGQAFYDFFLHDRTCIPSALTLRRALKVLMQLVDRLNQFKILCLSHQYPVGGISNYSELLFTVSVLIVFKLLDIMPIRGK